MRLTARGRAVLAVVLVALVGVGALLFFRPGPTGAPPPAEPAAAASAAASPTGAATAEPGASAPGPAVAWVIRDDESGEHQVLVERGDGLEVVYVATDATVRPVGWFGTSAADRVVLLVGQDLLDLVVVDLSTGADTPLDPRPAQDAWTDVDGTLVAVLAGDEGGYRQLRWDPSGAVVADDDVDAVPEHETPGAATAPPATLHPSPGVSVQWAGTAERSTLSVGGTAVADGTITSVLVWPPVTGPHGP